MHTKAAKRLEIVDEWCFKYCCICTHIWEEHGRTDRRYIWVELSRSIHIYIYHMYIVEGSLEVKLPTIWTVEKQRWEESEEKRSEERRSEEKESEERRCRYAKR